MLSHDDQTIVAQCTPTGSGAIALIRLSGKDAIVIAEKISRIAGVPFTAQASHTIHYGHVVNTDKIPIDQVLFLLMHGPRTFTGQDTVEITCHNNPFIIEAIIQQAIIQGARLAHNGEFTKRAVLNNKLDLVQAEAINELIHANSQSMLHKSLEQLEGSFSQEIYQLEAELLKALALSEASFEFLDEENIEFGPQIRTILESVLTSIKHLKVDFDRQHNLRQGIRITLIGAVNVGKSSLLNALSGKNRSIVTEIPGTTRDSIETSLYIDGMYWTLIDTAGLRITDDSIEQEGIKRSFEQARQADLLLLIFDGSRPLTPHERKTYTQLYKDYASKIVCVRNKIDLPQDPDAVVEGEEAVSVSSYTLYNIDVLKDRLQQSVQKLFSSIASPFLLNQRQCNLIITLEQQLDTLLRLCTRTPSYEIISYHLQEAIACMGELTGKTVSEAGMDMVFRNFCIGK